MFLGKKEHTPEYKSVAVKKEPHLLWKFKTNGQVISSPVIADSLVYIGSNDKNLYALDSSSGELIWKYETGGAINSTPLIADGKVMFLSYDGFFYALDAANGKLLWKFETGGESKFKVKDYFNGSFKPDFWDFYLSSAVVEGNTVYFGSSDTNIYALDIKTGEKIWNYTAGGSIHSSPAIAENSLVVGSWDGNIYCLDITTGEEKWKYSTEKDLKSYIWLGVQASPSIDNEVVYIGSRDAKFYALELETGQPIWVQEDFNRSWMPSSAAIGKENIYTGSSDSFSFYSIDKQTGAINYATKTNAYTFSSPAIDNEMAYIGSSNGRLYGIELESGDIKWHFKTGGIKSDTIRLFNEQGFMDVERYRELTKDIKDMPRLSAFMNEAFVNTGAILSSPVISNRVVYFGSSDGYVYAITDKP
ncbi:hypothetical protein GCM10010465_12870 [Actinomadura fibrosa]